MASAPRKRIGFAAYFLTSVLAAQQSPAPAFDVVSIRAVAPNAPPTMREIDFTPVLPGGQYINSRTTVSAMISFAYNVKMWLQMVGLPDWANEQSYSVAAKPAAGFPALSAAENREHVRLMMRAMLADRFHLKLHTETRQEQVFHLEVAKGGFKIKEVDPPVPPAKEAPDGAAMGNDGGRMIGNKSTMAGIASALTVFLKRPVIDRTGLKGYYDFDVKWSSPDADATPGLGADGIGLFISTLQKQLGLRVTKTTGPVEYWVVDHVEPPTDN